MVNITDCKKEKEKKNKKKKQQFMTSTFDQLVQNESLKISATIATAWRAKV